MTATGDDAVIEVSGLRMRYGTVDVLTGVDFTARRGEVLTLLGPNGAGKSTTIEILEGFRQRSAVSVRVLGADPATGSEAWRARIGVVLQSWRDHGRWRLRQLLAHLGAYYAPYATPYDVDELLAAVGLTEHASKKVPGLFLVPEVLGAGTGWVTLLGVVVLGLLATLPWGAVIGSFANGPNSLFGLVLMPASVLTAISGIFYPITALPGWLAGVAQVFPVYWLGLGTRSALLPDAAVVAEIGGSWRTPETVAVLVAWALAGFVVAPVVLRRMAGRESGADMQERRDRALARYGN